MGHNFVQQLLHVIWSTEKQQFIIPSNIKNHLFAYISTVLTSIDGKLYLAGGHRDHLHCLLSLPPTLSVAKLMQTIKSNTSKWIKHQQAMGDEFAWGDGYTVFSVQQDRVESVCTYILDEENRHNNLSYSDELSRILKLQNIQFDEKYFIERSHARIVLHIIWSTKNRIPLLNKAIQPILFQRISETACQHKCHVHAIGGIEDHMHLLLEIPRAVALSDLMMTLKGATSHWIKSVEKKLDDFEWQVGYGAFSISYSTIDTVRQYILKQEEHHKATSYSNEWNEFVLKKGVIAY
jgi:REP element-mobilizing transposase RayT